MENKENEAYLASVGVDASHANYARCLTILNSYGENRWWLSDDPKTRAYFQALEHTKSGLLLLPNAQKYILDLVDLLGRPVLFHELTQPEEIFGEAEEARQRGHGVSQQEGKNRVLKAMKQIREWTKDS